MRETIPGRVLRRANKGPPFASLSALRSVSLTFIVLPSRSPRRDIVFTVMADSSIRNKVILAGPTANRLLSGRSSNLSHRRHHLQNASGVKNIRPCCETQVVSDVFVQGTLLVAALKIPTIVNFHNASGVIGLIVICMQYTGVGITE